MTGDKRREGILNKLQNASDPVSGAALAKEYHVSRQVVVQDIALLRAAHHEISSTNRGYFLQRYQRVSRAVQVCHTDEQIEDELNLIVDLGGTVKDVFIEHGVYGYLSAKLGISSRRHVKEFLVRIGKGEAKPLKNLTSGYHSHTIEADSEEELDFIVEELKKKGYIQ